MAMATSTLVPLSEYLRTSYRPDRDWIDGELRERNMGEGPHAVIQGFFIGLLRDRRIEWEIRVHPEQRVQTSDSHYRIPDICVMRSSDPFEAIIRVAPLLCIEVLSWDDRMTEIQERVDDYFAMGVQAVWVVDPRRRRAFEAGSGGYLYPVTTELILEGTPIRVPVAEVFAELNELEGKTGV
jgi:Uma2 family endonuclease